MAHDARARQDLDGTHPAGGSQAGEVVAVIKFKEGEGQHYATLIRNTARPRTPAEAAELEVLIKRLEGGRS